MLPRSTEVAWCQQCPLHGAIVCLVARCMMPFCAKLPVAWCHRVPPSCPLRGDILCHSCLMHCASTSQFCCQVAHCVPKLPQPRCPYVAIKLPMSSCPSRGAIECLCCPRVPRKSIAWCNTVPTQPIAWCLCVPRHRVRWVPIAWCLYVHNKPKIIKMKKKKMTMLRLEPLTSRLMIRVLTNCAKRLPRKDVALLLVKEFLGA